MGRGRAKAKQVKVARQLKYSGGGTDLDRLRAELGVDSDRHGSNGDSAHAGVEKLLADRGIVYAPDYVVNAGGVIQVADELRGFSFERAEAKAAQILATTRQILAAADADGVPPAVAADRLAERRIAEVGRLRGIYLRA